MNFNEQGKRLTYIYMQRGMSSDDAAKKAYQDVLGEQYQTNGTWRMPNTAGQDIRDVRDGADVYLKNLSADQIMPLIGDARLPDDVNREQSISRIRDNAQWVTNSDETGLTLMMNGLLVNNAQGQPITVPFADSGEIGAGNRTTWKSDQIGQTPGKYSGQSNITGGKSARHLINMIQNGPADGTGLKDANSTVIGAGEETSRVECPGRRGDSLLSSLKRRVQRRACRIRRSGFPRPRGLANDPIRHLSPKSDALPLKEYGVKKACTYAKGRNHVVSDTCQASAGNRWRNADRNGGPVRMGSTA
ncbi:hypothetical protein KIN52_28865 (plasmid) [Klebsiella pneumoniae]|uniref:hypothetical protein n=1 Tax=Klebsiella pneumoniae TaxID=573 RepID=UPI00227A99F3|nr:hypothetical protein [Klebsiella pneumoniae]MCY3474810.1 hypothetical protein [Klebsiella pneumoniae]